MPKLQNAKIPRISPLRIWLPLIFWLIAIFALSAYPKAFIPQGKYISWDKLAHIIEFGMLGYLNARAFYFSGKPWLFKRWILITVVFGALFAAGDEWHQSFVPGRIATPWDAIADLIGVGLGIWLFLRSLSKKRIRIID